MRSTCTLSGTVCLVCVTTCGSDVAHTHTQAKFNELGPGQLSESWLLDQRPVSRTTVLAGK